MKLTDLLKQSGIELGKVYTDKNLPPFKVNETFVTKGYDVYLGKKGNGTTVWNRAKEVRGDYQTIAHISDKGKVKFYDKKMPSKVKKWILQKSKEGVSEEVNEATEYYKSKRKSDDLYYKKVGNKWYKSLASKKGKVKWYVVKFPGDLDSRDMNKINKNKLPSELNEASDKIQVQGIGVYSYDVLKQRVQKQTLDLAKQAKKGDWKRISKSGIEALASMWEALIKYEEKK